MGPLAGLYVPLAPAVKAPPIGGLAGLTLSSLALAGGIAAASVVLGYVPGRLLGCAERGRGVLFGLLLAPLLLPRYVLFYAWDLLLCPTTALGQVLGQNLLVARTVKAATVSTVMLLWYWPLAALLIGQGWRRVDAQTWRAARLDAGPVGRLTMVSLPLLRRPLALAFGVCLVMVLSEFATFHLAGMATIGTALAVIYDETFSVRAVARSAWPMVAIAVVVAVALWRRMDRWSADTPPAPIAERTAGWRWAVVATLLAVSVAAPVGLLIAHVTDMTALRRFWVLHGDRLAWSGLISLVAGLMALVTAAGTLAVESLGRWGRWLGAVMTVTILMALLLPGSVVAVSLLKLALAMNLPESVVRGWAMVSAGQAARLTGLSLLVLRLVRDGRDRHLTEMAAVDGASTLQAWRWVHWPRHWPGPVAAMAVVMVLGLTELPVTMVLLPAGVPCFAQWLLNQMHYGRVQQVIVSCLMLVGVYAAAAGVLLALLRWVRLRSVTTGIVACLLAVTAAGCDRGPSTGGEPVVVGMFGRTGRGAGEFIYPRAIDRAGDGTLVVVDKTGRIQRLTPTGECLKVFRMPAIESGKPVGVTVGDDGNLYVADTHYHRVLVFGPDGREIRRFGRFGQGDGEFIYPTDVAIAEDGRIFVGEYGGNDRISVFDGQGRFLSSFGSFGDGPGQLSRPAALCIDRRRGRLYVADACNHRIAIYDLNGKRQGQIGSVGRGPGQLRYPYDLALLPDGSLVVCEYGNNRLQLFSPDGRSVGVYGGPGRLRGQLAGPWGVTVDADRKAYVVDALNNRVQVWQL